ncbi:DUF4190 domain-containing protein [Amycolatopsis eburnea]|uniref:DUF4190 domain-containing protein n=1 Tax=Amycolatopsis eburnea TaxID=2267691 RepID=A0A427TFC2_9PSEU|nr:DUF4190 domain-containing protein [Amycolatopsis eburnea]RSD21842.1 DUF4190 domain-containing protein [Amycolatopsis eburnea]
MTDPSGDKDRPATDPTAAYDPPPPADPPSYEPATYDPPGGDATLADTTVADTPVAPEPPEPLPPGSFETPAAHIPGTPYAAPGQPVYTPPAYPQQPYAQYPSYVTPPQYAPYGNVARGQDNALAIGALVCSILGFCSGVTAIAGLVMGHIALSKSNRGEAGGRGLATAAVIVGYVVVALWVGFFTTLIVLSANGQLT